jgi:hypothetical protein
LWGENRGGKRPMKLDNKYFLIIIIIVFVFSSLCLYSLGGPAEDGENHYSTYNVEPSVEDYTLDLDENVTYSCNDLDGKWISAVMGDWDNDTHVEISVTGDSDNMSFYFCDSDNCIVSGEWSKLELEGEDNFVAIKNENCDVIKSGWFLGPENNYNHIVVTGRKIYINGNVWVQVSGDNIE